MRLFFLSLVLVATPAAAADLPDAARLKARAALALAFAAPAPPTYAEQYARAVKETMPLVVWVGQPARHLADCVCVECDSFPDTVAAPAVVVGVPVGGSLRRIDLPGRPSDAAVRAALRGLPTAADPLPAPK
jgi:hypothetical protein